MSSSAVSFDQLSQRVHRASVFNRLQTNATTPSENRVSSVYITDQERHSGIPSASTVGAAASILHRDGIVVLDNAVDVAHVDALHNRLASEVPALVADPETHWNQGKSAGNISQPPPFVLDLMFSDIWANPFATAVISAVLGPRPCVCYVNGNTALPHTHGQQKVHADLSKPYGSHPFAMVANYYLSDTDDSNGATEVWLRSHRDTNVSMHQTGRSFIKHDLLEKREAETEFPPIRPRIKKGSVVIRDLRLWHAGRSNPSNEPRIMLAFVHFPWWYHNPLCVTLPRAVKPFIESFEDKLVYQADFVDCAVDHMKVAFDPNFTSTNLAYRATFEPGPEA